MNSVEVAVGETILTSNGPVMVTAYDAMGVTVNGPTGGAEHIGWDRLTAKNVGHQGVQPVHWSLEPWWSSLDAHIQAEALLKMEAVLEITTGYRDGLPALARPGEPFSPFGDAYGASLWTRIQAMARTVTVEKRADRAFVRRVLAGEVAQPNVSASTVRLWVVAWQREGLRGLVDGRKVRNKQGFDALDPRFIRIAEDIFARFDGDVSVHNQQAIERQIRVRLKQEGVSDVHLPQRLLQEYLSKRSRELGKNTRAHKGKAMRRASSHSSYPATHPGHLAIDATRVDNLVFDDTGLKVYSVEIITVISVSTRVVVALRVVPRSASSLEAGLALYDAMRPFSMVVEGTSISDFRWCGIPSSLDFTATGLSAHRIRPRTDRALQGTHIKPGVAPMSLRADNGSIFLSAHFRSILRDFGVDLMPSRGSRPIDNAHVERWHETLQRAYQQIPGFKGRNVKERGRTVMRADSPLLTAKELETHLHRFVALDYHRSPHDGLRLPGLEGVSMTPLERFDILVPVTGRILVPQHPDLIYQFLPIRWLTVGAAGVEYRGLTYDGEALQSLRGLRSGTFRPADDKVPFLYDPRDRSRLWHRDRETDRIHELRWRDAHLLDAPLTDVVVDEARRRIRERGQDNLSKRKVMLQIIEELGELTSAPTTEDWRNKLIAARLRHEQARVDHAEVVEAHRLLDDARGVGVVRPLTRPPATAMVETFEPWPDYDELA